jgi:hypothetical protein
LVFAASASITFAQVTNVSQYSDVSSTDYYYEALRSLTERYGCVAGYPDGTFSADRPATRGEVVSNLNACLNQVERLVASGTVDAVTKEDLAGSIVPLQLTVESLRQTVESMRRSGGSVSPPTNERI